MFSCCTTFLLTFALNSVASSSLAAGKAWKNCVKNVDTFAHFSRLTFFQSVGEQFAGQKGLKSCHRGHFCIWRKIQNVAVSCAAFWFACIVRKFSHFPSLAISFGRPAAFSFCLPCASHLHFKFSSVVVPAFPDYPPAVFSTFKLWRLLLLLLLLSVALISRPECHAHYLLTSHASFTLEKQALCLMP